MAIPRRCSHVLSKIRLLNGHNCMSIRNTTTTNSTRRAEAVFIDTSALEMPVIAVTDKHNVDLIGPPDPVSNLRPIVRKRHVCETELQQTLRDTQDETQAWNQKFWADHNTRFVQQRKEFVQRKHESKGCTETLSAEEMSEFYKKFLDENWAGHVRYNVEWYRRNFYILWLGARASLPPSLHFIAK